MAQKMVDLGALTMLQKVNASTHLRSQSSEATFTQLLDYNLPAKLSLIGKLTQSNHVHSKSGVKYSPDDPESRIPTLIRGL